MGSPQSGMLYLNQNPALEALRRFMLDTFGLTDFRLRLEASRSGVIVSAKFHPDGVPAALSDQYGVTSWERLFTELLDKAGYKGRRGTVACRVVLDLVAADDPDAFVQEMTSGGVYGSDVGLMLDGDPDDDETFDELYEGSDFLEISFTIS